MDRVTDEGGCTVSPTPETHRSERRARDRRGKEQWDRLRRPREGRRRRRAMGVRADESGGRATIMMMMIMVTVMVEATKESDGEGVPPRCRQSSCSCSSQTTAPGESGAARARPAEQVSTCTVGASRESGECWYIHRGSLCKSLAARSLCMPACSRRRRRAGETGPSPRSLQRPRLRRRRWYHSASGWHSAHEPASTPTSRCALSLLLHCTALY